MDESRIEKDVKSELDYLLMLAKLNEDDPLSEAYLLHNLKEAYKQKNMKMPSSVKGYMEGEALRIAKFLAEEYPKKKLEYEKLLNELQQTSN